MIFLISLPYFTVWPMITKIIATAFAISIHSIRREGISNIAVCLSNDSIFVVHLSNPFFVKIIKNMLSHRMIRSPPILISSYKSIFLTQDASVIVHDNGIQFHCIRITNPYLTGDFCSAP